MRILVLGLGNPILGDDGVGLRVVQALQETGLPTAQVDLDTHCGGGLSLMERLVGYGRVIIVDAICTGRCRPGTVHVLGPDSLPTHHTASAHDVNLATALRLAKSMGLAVPEQITIIGIEADRVLDFSEELTPAVAAAVPLAVQAVLREIEEDER